MLEAVKQTSIKIYLSIGTPIRYNLPFQVMEYFSHSQDDSQIGFELVFSEDSIEVLLLKSSPTHMSQFLPQKVKNELKDFFAKHDKQCNLQKARNYALGRWAGFELIERALGLNFLTESKIINSVNANSLGKPFIFHSDSITPYCISIAHSHYSALSGFSKHKQIGVDLELQEPRSDSFLDLLLTPYEKLFVENNEARRDELLNAFWVGKEAVSKAVGRGLQIPLMHFEIELELEGLYKNKLKCRLSDPLGGGSQFWFRLFQKEIRGGQYTIGVAGLQE